MTLHERVHPASRTSAARISLSSAQHDDLAARAKRSSGTVHCWRCSRGSIGASVVRDRHPLAATAAGGRRARSGRSGAATRSRSAVSTDPERSAIGVEAADERRSPWRGRPTRARRSTRRRASDMSASGRRSRAAPRRRRRALVPSAGARLCASSRSEDRSARRRRRMPTRRSARGCALARARPRPARRPSARRRRARRPSRCVRTRACRDRRRSCRGAGGSVRRGGSACGQRERRRAPAPRARRSTRIPSRPARSRSGNRAASCRISSVRGRSRAGAPERPVRRRSDEDRSLGVAAALGAPRAVRARSGRRRRGRRLPGSVRSGGRCVASKTARALRRFGGATAVAGDGRQRRRRRAQPASDARESATSVCRTRSTRVRPFALSFVVRYDNGSAADGGNRRRAQSARSRCTLR